MGIKSLSLEYMPWSLIILFKRFMSITCTQSIILTRCYENAIHKKIQVRNGSYRVIKLLWTYKCVVAKPNIERQPVLINSSRQSRALRNWVSMPLHRKRRKQALSNLTGTLLYLLHKKHTFGTWWIPTIRGIKDQKVTEEIEKRQICNRTTNYHTWGFCIIQDSISKHKHQDEEDKQRTRKLMKISSSYPSIAKLHQRSLTQAKI